MVKTKNCKLCCNEFEQKSSYQKVCKRCWFIQKGYHSCETKECENMIKPIFKTCWSCRKHNYKPCNTDGCKHHILKESKFKICYNCNLKKKKEIEVESDSDDVKDELDN